MQAAKKEGSLSLYLFQGEGELGTVAQLFQKKYPEINVVTTLGRGNTLRAAASWRSGARASISSMLISAGVTTAYEVFYRAKILNSVRAALILPEVTDESKWWLGQHHYVDPENRYILRLSRQCRRVCFVQYQVGGGGRDSLLLGFSRNLSGKAKFSRAIRRFPAANASVCAMYYHTPELGAEFIRRSVRRDGRDADSGNPPDDRLAGQWQVRHLLFLFRNSEGEELKGCRLTNFTRRSGKRAGRFPRATWARSYCRASRRTRTPRACSSTGCSRAKVRRRFSVRPTRRNNSEESLRTDIPKDMVRSERAARRRRQVYAGG